MLSINTCSGPSGNVCLVIDASLIARLLTVVWSGTASSRPQQLDHRHHQCFCLAQRQLEGCAPTQTCLSATSHAAQFVTLNDIFGM